MMMMMLMMMMMMLMMMEAVRGLSRPWSIHLDTDYSVAFCSH